jgi:hypothetical protein
MSGDVSEPPPSGQTVRRRPGLEWTAIMGKSRDIELIVTVVGLFIGIFGVWFGIYQLKVQLGETALSAVYVASNEITKVFIEHPQLREHFEKIEPLEAGDERDKRLRKQLSQDPIVRDRVWALCAMHADFFEEVYFHKERHPLSDWELWRNYMKNVYDESPALRDYFSRRDAWYSVQKEIASGPGPSK